MKRKKDSYILYEAKNKINGKMYFGITTLTLEKRFNKHVYEAFTETNIHYNEPFKRAIRKYTPEGFELKVIKDNLSSKTAQELEKDYIKKFNTYVNFPNSNGYNATLGGDLWIHPSDIIVRVDVDTYKVVEEYDSGAEAMRYLNTSHSLYDICSGKIAYSKRFNAIFYKKKEYLNLLEKNELEKDVDIRLNKIFIIDKEYNILEKFRDAQDAADKKGGTQPNINAVINNKRNTCRGYIYTSAKKYYNNLCVVREKISTKKRVYIYDQSLNILEETTAEEYSLKNKKSITDVYEFCRKSSLLEGKYLSYKKMDKNDIIIMTSYKKSENIPNITHKNKERTKFNVFARIEGKNFNKSFDSLLEALKYRNEFLYSHHTKNKGRYLLSKNEFHEKYVSKFGISINDY